MIFSKEEYAQLLLIASEGNATEEQIDQFIRDCESVAIQAAQLDLIFHNQVEISGWNEHNQPYFKPREKPAEFMDKVEQVAQLITEDGEFEESKGG